MKDIIAHLGTQEFLRIRVGAGAKREGQDLVNHVLGRFSGEERELVEDAIQSAAAAVGLMVRGETDAAIRTGVWMERRIISSTAQVTSRAWGRLAGKLK